MNLPHRPDHPQRHIRRLRPVAALLLLAASPSLAGCGLAYAVRAHDDGPPRRGHHHHPSHHDHHGGHRG